MTTKRHIPTALAWIAFLAFCYGMIGPLFDHHFPERLPFHGHLFLSSAPALHLHPAYQSHTHSESLPEAQGSILFTAEGEGAQGPDGFSDWQVLSLVTLLSVAPLLLNALVGLMAYQRAPTPLHVPLFPPPRAAALPLH
ncbi:MAG: hypothetical protein HYU30_00500 [Chloroflexi bacterium]|nr:hypothetical protein [Chloroflexota bacterium]